MNPLHTFYNLCFFFVGLILMSVSYALMPIVPRVAWAVLLAAGVFCSFFGVIRHQRALEAWLRRSEAEARKAEASDQEQP